MAKTVIQPDAISYKNTPEDIELKEWLNTKTCKSAFIKDQLRKVMKEEKRSENNKELFLRL